jgi:hypothetical protein
MTLSPGIHTGGNRLHDGESTMNRRPRMHVMEIDIIRHRTMEPDPVRSVNFRRKSLSAKRIHLPGAHHDEWMFCKVRAVDGNLKICLYAVWTYAGVRRRLSRVTPCRTVTYGENGETRNGRKCYLKVLYIFKLGADTDIYKSTSAAYKVCGPKQSKETNHLPEGREQ